MKSNIQANGRRNFLLTASTIAATSALPMLAHAYPKDQPELELVATSQDHIINGVALTRSRRTFLGMPRWPGFTDTPSVGELMANGDIKPYPGDGYNDWKKGTDPTHAFVCVNAIHCFGDDYLWVVDTGDIPLDPPLTQPGAQKLVKIDTRTNKVVKTYTFDDVLPSGGSLNDLRIGGDKIYLTESGLGSIVIIDTKTEKIVRRLLDDPSTKADPSRPKIGRAGKTMTLPNGKPQLTNADPIELSPDHRWLYYQAASGPLYRVPTAALNDQAVTESELSKKVEYVYDTPTLGGTGMDSHGNIFLAESARPRISALAPDGTLRTLIEDERLWGADALFLTPDRHLYIPLSQVPNLQFVQGPGGHDLTTRPFKVYRMKLPARYGGPVKA